MEEDTAEECRAEASQSGNRCRESSLPNGGGDLVGVAHGRLCDHDAGHKQ